MFVSQTLWAVIGIAVIVLGIVMAYGMMRTRRRSPELDSRSDEATRQIYREERH